MRETSRPFRRCVIFSFNVRFVQAHFLIDTKTIFISIKSICHEFATANKLPALDLWGRVSHKAYVADPRRQHSVPFACERTTLYFVLFVFSVRRFEAASQPCRRRTIENCWPEIAAGNVPTEDDGTERLPARPTTATAADVTGRGIRFFRARLPPLLVLLPSVLSYGVRNRQNVTSYRRPTIRNKPISIA